MKPELSVSRKCAKLARRWTHEPSPPRSWQPNVSASRAGAAERISDCARSSTTIHGDGNDMLIPGKSQAAGLSYGSRLSAVVRRASALLGLHHHE
ncbi:hypothetical protein BN961_03859 [Afipia felis]|uniref:Uncharacterized protein n=1 Tax=Afipia felis TaxID=1035 RepID=A0A090MW83_AFIFE|nr:hypothetical protein BN961_03859 [Afipia felis]